MTIVSSSGCHGQASGSSGASDKVTWISFPGNHLPARAGSATRGLRAGIASCRCRPESFGGSASQHLPVPLGWRRSGSVQRVAARVAVCEPV